MDVVPDQLGARRSLDGQVAIVTGATRGIGRAVCKALRVRRARVVAVGKNVDALQVLTSELREDGGSAIGLALDVRLEADMQSMVQTTMERFGRIDILVASAGVLRVGSPRTVAEMSVSEWDTVVETNLRGTFLSNRAVMPVMMKQRAGNIINLSSTSGQQGLAFDAAYCASKFGVIGLSESLAEEARPHGVRVQVVLPGPVDTPMWDQNGPLPRPPQLLPAERIADLILYLLTLPEDTLMIHPTVIGFRSRRMGQK